MKFRIGLAQSDARLGDVEANLQSHLGWIERGRAQGVDLMIFPELSLTGYLLQDIVPEVSMKRDDPRLVRLAAAGGDMALCIGGIEESDQHAQYIACFYTENGAVRHVHRKVYLASYGVFDEARYVGAGQRIAARDTRLGRLGFSICEDSWHPSLVTLLLLDGAQLIVVQTASPVRDLREGEMPQNARIWLDTLRTYARLYGTYIAFCNRVGTEDGLVFWGHSQLLDPRGETVASAALYDEEFIVADVDTEATRQARLSNPVLRDERLELTLKELGRLAGLGEGGEGLDRWLNLHDANRADPKGEEE